MKRRLTAIGLLLWVLGCGAIESVPAESAGRVIHPDDQWRLAHMYLERGDTDRAVSEFERFCFFFPDDPRTPSAGVNIGRAHLTAGRFEAAVTAFSRVIEGYGGKSPAAIDAHFLTAEAYRRWGRPGQAVLCLQNLLAGHPSIDIRNEAWFQMGWLAIEAGGRERTLEYFGNMTPDARERRQVPALETALSQMERLPQKNPALSGALSVIPGLGYLYCDRPRDAGISFLVNAGLMAAAWEAFHEDLPILGGILTLVEIGFYGGNIHGGIAAAHKHNRAERIGFIDRLKERFNLSLGPVAVGDGMGLGVRGSF